MCIVQGPAGRYFQLRDRLGSGIGKNFGFGSGIGYPLALANDVKPIIFAVPRSTYLQNCFTFLIVSMVMFLKMKNPLKISSNKFPSFPLVFALKKFEKQVTNFCLHQMYCCETANILPEKLYLEVSAKKI